MALRPNAPSPRRPADPVSPKPICRPRAPRIGTLGSLNLTPALTVGAADVVFGTDTPELQRLFPTVIKAVEWTEDAKTGEGIVEIRLWEEVQKAFGAAPLRVRRNSDEPLVVSGSPECPDRLPERDPLRSVSPSWTKRTPRA